MNDGGARGRELDDVTVIRVGASLAGDYLCSLLADHGATVETVTLDAVAGTGFAGRLRGADVLLDDARPGAVASAGWPAGRIHATRPSIVVCAIVPSLTAEHPGWSAEDDDIDAKIAAEVGINRLGGTPPHVDPLPVASHYASLIGAVYVVAALLREARDRVAITVPLDVAAATVLSRRLVDFDAPPMPDGATRPHLPMMEIYRCRDGRFVQLHGLYPKFVRALMSVAGHPEWVDDAVSGLDVLPDRETEALWRGRFAELFLRGDSWEWERDINAAGGACTVVRTRAESLAEPHLVASGILAKPGPGAGRLSSLGPAVTVIPTAGAGRGAPLAGPLPLDGVRVVDLCIVLAGPTCGRILGELGAEVVKVDSPDREITPFQWFDVNRTKESIIVDLRTDGGVEVVGKLIDRADVVLQNFRSGKLAGFGLDARTLVARHPGLVVTELNAFDYDGPWEERAGWEHNAQAASGMQDDRARATPVQVPYPVNDYATGYLGAFGTLVALRGRQRRGNGSIVRGSLLRTAVRLQAGSRCAVEASTARDGHPAEADVHDAATQGELSRRGILRRFEHPKFGRMRQVVPRPACSVALDRPGWPAPDRGADGRRVLGRLGYGPERIGALVDSGAVGEGLGVFERWAVVTAEALGHDAV
ncbi:CoA transferase [Dactylosporangium sp. NPDC051485]|uniref:CoA transferase n=1 Tax=Dactylosporangium sp. NPDC051485 TaxID=3154846 RepID=UPI0034343073